MPTDADQSIWIADVKAVLEALPHINADVHDTLCSMFDLDRIGMFGHSFGGSTAFQLCCSDERVKAWVSLYGVLFGEYQVIESVQKPFMFIVAQGSVDTHKKFSPEELAEKHNLDVEFLKENLKRFKNIYQGFTPTATLQRVIIQDLQHGGFTDFVLLKDLPVCRNNKSIVDLDAYMGSGDGFALMAQITREIVKFFNTYL